MTEIPVVDFGAVLLAEQRPDRPRVPTFAAVQPRRFDQPDASETSASAPFPSRTPIVDRGADRWPACRDALFPFVVEHSSIALRQLQP